MKDQDKAKEQLVNENELAELRQRITELEPGDHLCCIYETEEEHRAVLTPFLRQGLGRGDKVVYIVDARTAETVLGYLRDDPSMGSGQGLDVEFYLASGQLSILTVDDAYMREGVFDPDGMIALLRTETERALAEGYAALRVTGEMTWALRGLPGSERLIEYEAKLNEFFGSAEFAEAPGSKCLALCQYDRRRFGPEVLLDVLRTHPIAVVGTVVYDNFYYIPPAELLGGDLPAAELRHWVQNLAERKRAEETLQASYRHQAGILGSMLDAVIVANPDGTICTVNRAALELLGYSEQELIGQPVGTIFEEEEEEEEEEEAFFRGSGLAQLLREGAARDVELTLLAKSGERIPVVFNGSVIRDDEGHLRAVLGVARDMRERKRAEEELQRTLEKLREALGGIIQTVALTVETRDPYTAGHQRRVGNLARAIANEMGLSEDRIDGIRMTGLIHDLGKIGVPAEILIQPGLLNDLQYGLIQAHSQVGYDILKRVDFPWPVAQIVLQHHERLDGSGYPQGLSGEEIMVEARILAVADVVEAMASFRPYRSTLGIDKALEEISQNKGVLYDSEVVDACLRLFTEKGFEFE